MKPKITFDKEAISFMLEAIGYKVGSLNQVLDEYSNPALDLDGKPFFTEDLIGIVNGYFITRESQLFYLSEILLKNKLEK